MTDSFAPVSAEKLYQIIFSDDNNQNLLGIPPDLIFNPLKNRECQTKMFNALLSSPFGVAAGPHSQMAQNIISAWLGGARYIELKTVQTLDELTVSKPCIDMQDEGYNCEWSQELKIKQSFEEYLKAWIFIHLLSHKLGFGDDPKTIFNMSVGYNYEGICQDNVQWFLAKMTDCREEKEAMVQELATIFPEIKKITIPNRISDNITLSTMHGCPPEEIEKIGKYLIEVKKLNTFIKLNPTLLGAETLRNTLNSHLQYKTIVPDEAFDHDLKFDQAVAIIRSLSESAAQQNVFFGIKLTNTLESINNRSVFNSSEKMMYMSGRALHPISVALASKLQEHFKGKLNISFSGGADFSNITEILNCGIYPVTVCSDLLKPGGYGRLHQYTASISKWISERGENNVGDFMQQATSEVFLTNLKNYALAVGSDPYYKKDVFSEPNIKSGKKLKTFDCISAPCVNTCPTNQEIPEYLYHTAHSDFNRAMEVILKTNPLPAVCGMVCDHECQSKCTRVNYDQPLLIREIKRFVTEQKIDGKLTQGKGNNLKAAIIGAGPTGLSCSFFLALAGFGVTVYETKAFAGGMVSDAIPQFRLTREAINSDIERVKALGVRIIYESKIDKAAFDQLQKENDYIYIAVGAQKAKTFDIPGSHNPGVVDPLVFLSEIKKNNNLLTGDRIAVVGGGNTAIDVARTAKRLTGSKGKVSILYRRAVTEMPADAEEIKAAIKEGIDIQDFTLPIEILSDKGILTGIKCCRMKAGEPGADGRATPVMILDSEFMLDFDTVIPALGQEIIIDFLDEKLQQPDFNSYRTQLPNVFFGGDALRGASSIIKAIADGRKTAAEIIAASVSEHDIMPAKPKKHGFNELMVQRSQREFRKAGLSQPTQMVLNQQPLPGLTKDEAIAEAARCMHCDELCNICVTVCPNRANVSYRVEPTTLLLQKAVLSDNKEIVFADGNDLHITQEYQILNIADFCNECGNCTTFCPTSGRPFHDKPRFFINISKFKESEEGYFFHINSEKNILVKKRFFDFSTLSFENDKFLFQNDKVAAYFLPDFTLIHVKFLDRELTEYEFDEAAEMYVLFNALKDLAFFSGN